LDSEQANHLRSDFSAAQEAVKTGVSAGRASSAIAVWNIWSAFTSELGLDPFLQAFPDKIPVLQIFAVRVRCGELSASGCAVRARSAEDYVRHVAQAFLNVGAEDPRLNSAHQIDFRLQRMIKSWKSSNPAPLRVKPIPIQVIRRVDTLSQLSSANDSLYQATTDMIILAFFFLLRPGEYTDNDNTPFCLKDVQLFIGPRCLNLQTSSAAELAQACFGSLTFTDQKNGVRGKVIGQASMGGLGLVKPMGEQLTIQATALGATVLWSALATVVIALIVKVLIGLRVDADQESEGLDRSEHGENAYPMEP